MPATPEPVTLAEAEKPAAAAEEPPKAEAAMSDAAKRKAPEPAATPAAEEPASKRLKATAPDPAAIRKQVEYSLSDDNLRHDKFFHDKISANGEGWLDLNLVLTCNKMKAMRAGREDVLAALKESSVEVRLEPGAVRRPQNKALPPLQAKPQHQQKKKLHAHDGGIVVLFKKVPEEQSWIQVKEKLREKLPQKTQIWYASHISDKQECVVACAPFENDVAFFEELKLDLGGASVTCEVCHGDALQACLKLMPKNIREKREKEARKQQKERNRPIVVGSQRFMNLGALRGRVKEILNSRSDGEALKEGGADFKLMQAILAFHPNKEKGKGLVGIKVGKSPQGDSRCFFMVRGDGCSEDFSAKKCLDVIDQNPPYADEKTEAKAAPAGKPAEAATKPAEAAAKSAEAAGKPAEAAEKI